ncbi:coiled-coil domain-containing protein 183 isoform X2 [Ascaphus truei]|uniref:coiled-coil domain-containing protein 183 isoform X2 n=1 Tax=Ascaphus truei TaxID=8439 RepID=UPI003F594E2E
MKLQKRWDINVQIKELRAILLLQEQGRTFFSQTAQETIGQNRENIKKLRINAKHARTALDIAKQYDAATIAQACRGQKKKKLALTNSKMTDARDQLQKYLFDAVNAYNKVKYEVRKREKCLEDMESDLDTLKRINLPDMEKHKEQQMIRQLENKIDKMVIKLSSAGNINQTYLKILQNLEDELVHFPVHLNVMENTVLAYGKELESLTQMADEAIISREAIKMSLNSLEERVWKKRKSRESNLNRNKKMLIDLIDKQPPQKESAKKDLNMEFPSIVESETPSTGFKSVDGKSHSKQQRQIADIDQLKSVVECGELSSADAAMPTDHYDKLNVCEDKLRCLMESGSNMLKTPWIDDDHSESFLKVRELLETTTVLDNHNQRIEFEFAASKEPFEFEGLEREDALTRDEIKKLGKKLIEMKKKVGKPPKKKTRGGKSPESRPEEPSPHST